MRQLELRMVFKYMHYTIQKYFEVSLSLKYYINIVLIQIKEHLPKQRQQGWCLQKVYELIQRI